MSSKFIDGNKSTERQRIWWRRKPAFRNKTSEWHLNYRWCWHLTKTMPADITWRHEWRVLKKPVGTACRNGTWRAIREDGVIIGTEQTHFHRVHNLLYSSLSTAISQWVNFTCSICLTIKRSTVRTQGFFVYLFVLQSKCNNLTYSFIDNLHLSRK
jgi:hypothetical protein